MLTGVIITKNEEKNISEAITNLDFCDEIIVCDNNSSDKTTRLAKDLKAKVFSKKFTDYSQQRNYALDRAVDGWIFFLDADERVTNELRDEIKTIVKNNLVDGVYFKRTDYFLGKKLHFGETGSVRLLRLAKKASGVWRRGVHEYWDVEGRTTNAKNGIQHNSHSDLSSLIEKLNKYSKIHALENSKSGKISNIAKVIFFPVLKFKLNYIIRMGFLDAVHGFVFALMMSFHSFLSWSILFLEKNKKQ